MNYFLSANFLSDTLINSYGIYFYRQPHVYSHTSSDIFKPFRFMYKKISTANFSYNWFFYELQKIPCEQIYIENFIFLFRKFNASFYNACWLTDTWQYKFHVQTFIIKISIWTRIPDPELSSCQRVLTINTDSSHSEGRTFRCCRRNSKASLDGSEECENLRMFY